MSAIAEHWFKEKFVAYSTARRNGGAQVKANMSEFMANKIPAECQLHISAPMFSTRAANFAELQRILHLPERNISRQCIFKARNGRRNWLWCHIQCWKYD